MQAVCAVHRLRISLSAAHTIEDVDALLAAIKESGIVYTGLEPTFVSSSAKQDVVVISKL
jgi:hypothetical protein